MVDTILAARSVTDFRIAGSTPANVREDSAASSRNAVFVHLGPPPSVAGARPAWDGPHPAEFDAEDNGAGELSPVPAPATTGSDRAPSSDGASTDSPDATSGPTGDSDLTVGPTSSASDRSTATGASTGSTREAPRRSWTSDRAKSAAAWPPCSCTKCRATTAVRSSSTACSNPGIADTTSTAPLMASSTTAASYAPNSRTDSAASSRNADSVHR
ncbi:hypothetical protein GCM10018963_65010 [Saccharothrix longispora]